MKPSDIIRHENHIVVAFFVMHTTKMSDHILVTGMWLNQGRNVTSVLNGEIQEVRIRPENIHRWRICDNPNLECVRNSSWSPLKGAA